MKEGDIRIKQRGNKYCVEERQADGKYAAIEGGECDSIKLAETVKERYLLTKEAVKTYNEQIKIKLGLN